jgi:pentapeptide MXKDX repeat protein
VFAVALGKASSEVYNFAGPAQSNHNLREFACYEPSKEHLNMKRVLALLFAIALSVSMSSFAFAQDNKPEDKPMDKMDKPMDKMDKPMDKKEDTKAKRHHKYHKKEKKEEMKKDEMKKDEPK